MAEVHRIGLTDTPQGASWIVIEKAKHGKFTANGSSLHGEMVFAPGLFDSEAEAIGAAQTWAFHNAVDVIYVRT